MKNYVRLQENQVPKGHFQIKSPQILMFFLMNQKFNVVQVAENALIDDSKYKW